MSKISVPVQQIVAGTDTKTKPPSHEEMHKREFEARAELADEEAIQLIEIIKSRL
jgi:hypothetical protein